MPSYPPACRGCPQLSRSQGFVAPDVNGPRLIAWGEAPGLSEVQKGRGFVGVSGRLLRGAMSKLGLKVWYPGGYTPSDEHLEDVLFANTRLCRPRGNKYDPDLGSGCIERHTKDLARDPRPQVCFGANATVALTGFHLSPLKTRGSLLPITACESKRWVKSTIHPAFITRAEGKGMGYLYPFLMNDIKMGMEHPTPRVPTVHMSDADTVLGKWREAGRPKLVAIDIEGHAPNPHIVGFSWKIGEAWVIPWTDSGKRVLGEILSKTEPIFHNAAFDIPELHESGVIPPRLWVDTINLAALFNRVSGHMDLQSQVLTFVPGAVTWKGLVDHKRGPEYAEGAVGEARRLWRVVLGRLGRPWPRTGQEWYAFYNGLDTAWSLELAHQLRRQLGERMEYYREVLQPLQSPLLEMGSRGIPFDVRGVERLKQACQRLERMAGGILRVAGEKMREAERRAVEEEIATLEEARNKERAGGQRKFTQAPALSKLRGNLRALKTPFNPASPKQRAALLYDYLKLPCSRTAKGNPSVGDEVVESLISRLERRTITATGTGIRGAAARAIALRLCRAIIAVSKWGHWRRNYLERLPEGAEGIVRIPTQYSLHRTDTGRLTSGMDNSDETKGVGRKKVAQLQNVPKRLRRAVVAPPGYLLVGGDWAGIEWALVMYFAGTKFHLDLLDRQQSGEMDPHRYLASIAYSKTEAMVSSDERATCKPFTHGRNYMGSPRTLARAGGFPDAVGLKVCEAHEEAFKVSGWQLRTLTVAKRQGYVETPLGWRRYFFDLNPKPTEVLATLIQGTAACLCKWVARKIFEQRPPEVTEVLTTTHDSFLLLAPEPLADRASSWLKTQMEQEIPWLRGRRWAADVKVGRTWKEVS